MEGAAITGQLFTSLHLDDFAIRVELLYLLQGQRILRCVQARYKDSVFYAKEIEVGP